MGKKGLLGCVFWPGATTPLEVRRSSGMGASHELPGDSYESEPKTASSRAVLRMRLDRTRLDRMQKCRPSSLLLAVWRSLCARACAREKHAACLSVPAHQPGFPSARARCAEGAARSRGTAVGAHHRSRRAPGQPGGDRLPSGAAAHRTTSVGSPTHPSSSAHSQMPPPRAPQQWTACGLCRGSIVIGIVPLRVIKDEIKHTLKK